MMIVIDMAINQCHIGAVLPLVLYFEVITLISTDILTDVCTSKGQKMVKKYVK